MSEQSSQNNQPKLKNYYDNTASSYITNPNKLLDKHHKLNGSLQCLPFTNYPHSFTERTIIQKQIEAITLIIDNHKQDKEIRNSATTANWNTINTYSKAYASKFSNKVYHDTDFKLF